MRYLTLLILLAGCGGSSKYMVKDDTPDAAAPTAGNAVIVFVRPSGWGSGNTFTVLDGKGKLVGQIPGKSHVLYAAKPGKQRFLIWAENTAVLEADVAAGKICYVEVPVAMGMWSARSHLYPVKRGSDNWDTAEKWVAKTTQWDLDPALAEKWTADKGGKVAEQLKRADEMWAKYDKEEREKRTMRPDDGR